MRCEAIERQLSDYLDDSLPQSIKREVERHLRTCRLCSQELEAIRQTLRLVRVAEGADPIQENRLVLLQTRVLHTLDQEQRTRWYEQISATSHLRLRSACLLWSDLMDFHGWARRLQAILITVLLVFMGIWVDRQYFRANLTELFPELVRELLVAETPYVPAAFVGSVQPLSPRVPLLLDLETEALRNDDALDYLTHRLAAPSLVADSGGMEVRAIDLRDGKLLFVGIRDVTNISDVDTEEPPLRDVSMPTSNARVVMLPRNFDEPIAPSRGSNQYFLAELLNQSTYPVASPTRVLIEDQ